MNFQGTTKEAPVRQNRPLGGQTDGRRIRSGARVPEPLPPGPSAQEEAVLIAERLAALVASRRAGSAQDASADASPAESGTPRSHASADASARSHASADAPADSLADASADAPAARPARPLTAPPASGPVLGARHSGRLLGNLLLTRGFIIESELQYALSRQSMTGGPIGQILVDLGLITDHDLVELLAEQLRMHVIDLGRIECDRSVLALLTKGEARRLAALPLRRVDGHIDVAIADPTDEAAVGELTRAMGAPVRLLLATRADIDAAIDRLYG